MRSGLRRKSGSGIIETAAGLIFLIPVLFILIDVAALVIAQTANDQLAKQCARAAAEKPSGLGQQAADDAFANFANNGLCTKQGAPALDYGAQAGAVKCTTTIVVKLPIPVPFGGPATQTFQAFSTEPIVGDLP